MLSHMSMRIRKYSLEVLTSVQGTVGNSDICNGTLSFLGVVTWYAMQDFTFSSTMRSIFGNQTFSRTNALVLVIPMWPLWAISTTFSRSVSGTTVQSYILSKPNRAGYIVLPWLSQKTENLKCWLSDLSRCRTISQFQLLSLQLLMWHHLGWLTSNRLDLSSCALRSPPGSLRILQRLPLGGYSV